MRGGDGADHIAVGQGVDVNSGGDGNDVLWAYAHKDVEVDGVDTLLGGTGNDRLRARDGEADLIDCGRGRRDKALLDQVDVIVDATPENPNGSCEAVLRADPPPDPTPEP